MNKNIEKLLSIIGIALNLIALSRQDYTYYQFLRVYNFLIFSIFAHDYYSKKTPYLFIISLSTLIIYNPIEKLELHRSTWEILNLFVVVLFLGKLFIETKRRDVIEEGLSDYQKKLKRIINE